MKNHNGVRKPRKWARRLRKVLQCWRMWRSPRHRQQLKNFKDEKKKRDKNMLKPSEFDKSKWGCPKCGFPVDQKEDDEHGNFCSCGLWVALPHYSPNTNNTEKCKYCEDGGTCPLCNGRTSETCVKCFGTGECGACLGTGKDMEEEIEAHLLYRISQ